MSRQPEFRGFRGYPVRGRVRLREEGREERMDRGEGGREGERVEGKYRE